MLAQTPRCREFGGDKEAEVAFDAASQFRSTSGGRYVGGIPCLAGPGTSRVTGGGVREVAQESIGGGVGEETLTSVPLSDEQDEVTGMKCRCPLKEVCTLSM
jgi:hypothetical protein